MSSREMLNLSNVCVQKALEALVTLFRSWTESTVHGWKRHWLPSNDQDKDQQHAEATCNDEGKRTHGGWLVKGFAQFLLLLCAVFLTLRYGLIECPDFGVFHADATERVALSSEPA